MKKYNYPLKKEERDKIKESKDNKPKWLVERKYLVILNYFKFMEFKYRGFL